MSISTALTAVRKRHDALEALPDTILIPAFGTRRDAFIKPIAEATLDDLAFALRKLEAEFNAAGDRMHAIRKLYGMARQAGALGAERAIDAISRDMGSR